MILAELGVEEGAVELVVMNIGCKMWLCTWHNTHWLHLHSLQSFLRFLQMTTDLRITLNGTLATHFIAAVTNESPGRVNAFSSQLILHHIFTFYILHFYILHFIFLHFTF